MPDMWSTERLTPEQIEDRLIALAKQRDYLTPAWQYARTRNAIEAEIEWLLDMLPTGWAPDTIQEIQ